MGVRIVAGIVGFVVVVLVIQSYVLGGDGDDPGENARAGAAPTATLPAQLPEPVDLGAVQAGDGAPDGGGATGTTGGGTYIVQSGDTLGSIAASFNVAPEAQADWINEVLDLNGIEDARTLQAGQELTIPEAPAGADVTPAEGSEATNGATPEAVTPGEGIYIVVSGDSPLGIAEKFCVESPAAWVNELVALNGIDPSVLAVGQELELPAGTPPQCVQ